MTLRKNKVFSVFCNNGAIQAASAMAEQRLIIFGAGDFAEVAHYYFSRDSSYTVSAFCVDGVYLKETTMCGLPVVPFEELPSAFPPRTCHLFIAVAYRDVNRARAAKFGEAKQRGYTCASFVSSKLSVLEVLKLGENCFIFEDNTIQPFTKFGDNVIVWSGNHIGHHAQVGNHVFISSHVCIGGRAVIGDYCFLGINSTIRDAVTIGEQCVIGAGSLILKDTSPKQVIAAGGTPTRRCSSDDVSL